MMKRVLAITLSSLLLFVCTSCAHSQQPLVTYDTFPTVGYYCHFWLQADPPLEVLQKEIAFCKQSGFNTMHILDIAWFYQVGEHRDACLQTLQQGIQMVKDAGMTAYVILLTNLEQWTGPEICGNGAGKMFDPADTEKMDQRLGYIRETLEYCKQADGISLFAGDPGGVIGTEAQGGISYYVDMAKSVQQFVKEIIPQADFHMNLWAVSQYVASQADPLKVDFWLAENTNARDIIALEDLLGQDIGLEVAGHDYYRELAFDLYTATGRKPASSFPQETDVRAVLEKDAQMWAFSHSLLADLDNDSGTPVFNTVRVYQYIQKMRSIGMQGVVNGATSLRNYADLYAYARFANDATATPESVLAEYARYMADEDSADALFEIFKFLNNYEEQKRDLSDEYKVAMLPTTLQSGRQALALFQTVTANPSPADWLRETPQEYLQRIEKKLQLIANAEPPEDWDGTVISHWIQTFDSDSCMIPTGKEPTLNGGSGVFVFPAAGADNPVYRLASADVEPLDLSSIPYGYLHLDVYAEQATRIQSGYLALGSSSVAQLGSTNTVVYPFKYIQLNEGWNHITVPLSAGERYGDPIDWSCVNCWRILFYNHQQSSLRLYVDNFYVANTADAQPPAQNQ